MIADEHTTVLSLLNGIDSEEIIGEVIDPEQVVPCFIRVAAQHNGTKITFNPASAFGIYYGSICPAQDIRIAGLNELFEGTALSYHACEDIIAQQWHKYALNISANLPQAVLNVGTGAYRDSEHAAWMRDALAAEVLRVAEAYGIHINHVQYGKWKPEGRLSTLQDLDQKREDLRHFYQNITIDDFTGLLQNIPGSMGINVITDEVDLLSKSDLHFDGRPVLHLDIGAAAVPDDYYLRGIVRSEYTGHGWAIPTGSYRAHHKLFRRLTKDNRMPQTIFHSDHVDELRTSEGKFPVVHCDIEALQDENMIDADSVVELLENKITLIVPKGSETGITGFEDITKAENIAIGDPESVPAGQYAQEAFESLGMWEDVQAKASLGTNVTEVLSWVSEGSADAGVVYLTDATTSDQADKIDIIGYAPEGSCKKVIYPVGIVSASEHKEAAAKFIEYLQTEEGLAAFEKYGFSPNAQ